MASRTSTPSRSRSSSSSSSSDTTMMDAPPQSPSRPARLRNPSHSTPSTTAPLQVQTQTQTSPPDPTVSLLLSLPRELRDRIYTFALVSRSPFWWPGQIPDSVKAEHAHINVALLRANRQIYEESAPILYGLNKFLFTHPSDCNMFRVVASPASVNITSVYFKIREKDLRLWTTYLGSKNEARSLKGDLPKLKSLWVFLKCGGLGVPGIAGLQGPNGGAGGGGGVFPGVQMQIQAAQNALGHQMHALQQQVQTLTQVMANAGSHIVGGGGGHANATGNQIPPPPPPAPAIPFIQFAQGALGFGPHHHHHHHHHVPHPHGTQNNPPNPSPLAQHLAHTQHVNTMPPPPPPPPHTTHHGGAGTPDTHTLFSSFLRFEREMGIESLCLTLRDVLRPTPTRPLPPFSHPTTSPTTEPKRPLTRMDRMDRLSALQSSLSSSSSSSFSPPNNNNNNNNNSNTSDPSNSNTKSSTEIKIICTLRVPRRELERLVALYPDELSVDSATMDARTRFRKLHGADVSLELSGHPSINKERGTDEGLVVQGP